MTSRPLVVGGGIAGFSLLRALSLHGVPCTLVERLATPPGSGLGLNLPGNALRALATLGLADEVVQRGMRIRRREYRNQVGRLLFAVDEEAFWGEVGPSVCLRRGDLLDILCASNRRGHPPLGHPPRPRRAGGRGRAGPAGVGPDGDLRHRGGRRRRPLGGAPGGEPRGWPPPVADDRGELAVHRSQSRGGLLDGVVQRPGYLPAHPGRRAAGVRLRLDHPRRRRRR